MTISKRISITTAAIISTLLDDDIRNRKYAIILSQACNYVGSEQFRIELRSQTSSLSPSPPLLSFPFSSNCFPPSTPFRYHRHDKNPSVMVRKFTLQGNRSLWRWRPPSYNSLLTTLLRNTSYLPPRAFLRIWHTKCTCEGMREFSC